MCGKYIITEFNSLHFAEQRLFLELVDSALHPETVLKPFDFLTY